MIDIKRNHFYVGPRRMRFNSKGDCIRDYGDNGQTLYVKTKAFDVIKPLCKEANRTESKVSAARMELLKRRDDCWSLFAMTPHLDCLRIGCQRPAWAQVKELMAMRDRAMKRRTK